MLKHNFELESDMRYAVYDAISKVCFDWRNSDLSEEQITTAVYRAIAWWSSHFFEDYYTDDEE